MVIAGAAQIASHSLPVLIHAADLLRRVLTILKNGQSLERVPSRTHARAP
jgi:hypothetical protein